MKYYFAVDIGGTKTAVAVYDERYRQLRYARMNTEPSAGAEKLAEKIRRMTFDWPELQVLSASCIACPGPLSRETGRVFNNTTLGWKNVCVTQLFADAFGTSFSILNDCNAGALGAAKDYDGTLVYLSISTGIGGGIVSGGRLFEGAGNAAEFGHLAVKRGRGLKCGCGRTDCLELYASGTAVEKAYFELTGERASGEVLARKAQAGDEKALDVYHEAAVRVNDALADILTMIDPDRVVVGGGAVESPIRRFIRLPDVSKAMLSFANGDHVLLGAARVAAEGL